jgi:hypothetical protein
MSIPFWLEWNATIPFLLEWKPSFQMEWNGHSIPARMECHFFNNLKKYAYCVHTMGWLLTGAVVIGALVGGDRGGLVLRPVALLVSPSVLRTGLCPPSL